MTGQATLTPAGVATVGEATTRQFSLEKCRAILGASAPESDAELSRLREQLYGLARVVVDTYLCNGSAKRLPREPQEKSAPTNYSELLASLTEAERYEVEERAAIHEFDGGLDRSAAERRTFSEYSRAKKDVDGIVS